MHKLKLKAIRLFFNRLYFTSNHSRLQKLPVLFILCFSLSICRTYSQNTDLPFKAAISVGPSFPVGKFSSTVPDSSSFPSAAKPGPLITVSFSYKFRHSLFGVRILGGWQQNNVNDLAIARHLADGMPVGSEIGVKTDNWHIWKILAGPTFEVPFTKNRKTSFECSVLGGVLKTTIPGYEIGATYGNPPTAIFESVSKIPLPASFCYQIDAGINYRITPSLLLTGNLGFMHATPVHSFTEYLDPPYYQMPFHVSQPYPVSTINLLVGIAYLF
jgi:hypothetical protein